MIPRVFLFQRRESNSAQQSLKSFFSHVAGLFGCALGGCLPKVSSAVLPVHENDDSDKQKMPNFANFAAKKPPSSTETGGEEERTLPSNEPASKRVLRSNNVFEFGDGYLPWGGDDGNLSHSSSISSFGSAISNDALFYNERGQLATKAQICTRRPTRHIATIVGETEEEFKETTSETDSLENDHCNEETIALSDGEMPVNEMLINDVFCCKKHEEDERHEDTTSSCMQNPETNVQTDEFTVMLADTTSASSDCQESVSTVASSLSYESNTEEEDSKQTSSRKMASTFDDDDEFETESIQQDTETGTLGTEEGDVKEMTTDSVAVSAQSQALEMKSMLETTTGCDPLQVGDVSVNVQVEFKEESMDQQAKSKTLPVESNDNECDSDEERAIDQLYVNEIANMMNSATNPSPPTNENKAKRAIFLVGSGSWTPEASVALYCTIIDPNKREKSPMEQLEEQQVVVLKKCTSGLGMKICGGLSEEGKYTGIFIRKILTGGAVDNEGTLQEGDELLYANGNSLRGCDNDEAVAILRKSAQTGTTKIVFKRDTESRQKFETLFPNIKSSLYSTGNQNGSLSRSDSTCSRLSTTSLEKRAWIFHGDRMSPAPLRETPSRRMQSPVSYNHEPRINGSASFLANGSNPMASNPVNLRNIQRVQHPMKDFLSTFERTASLDSGLPFSSHYSSPENSMRGNAEVRSLVKIDIPARTNLGISICGGKNKPEGPHIYVKEVIQGCDAYRDGRLKKGDQIVSINEESTEGVTYEQARSMLMRLKLRKDLTKYTVVYAANPSQFPASQEPAMTSPALETMRSNNGVPDIQSRFEQNGNPAHEPQYSPVTESATSQMSDEDALMKELRRMVENSGDDNDATHDITAALELPHDPVNAYDTSTSPRFSMSALPEDHQTISPTYLTASQFVPGLMSSPDEHQRSNQFESASPPNQSISHYLEQDIKQRYATEAASRSSNRLTSSSYSRKSRDRRLSLDPGTRIKVEKLEAALNYLGFEASPLQIEAVRNRIHIDANGCVHYGDFVNAAREALDVRLEDHSRTLNEANLQFAMRDIDAMEKEEALKAKQRESENFTRVQEMQRRYQDEMGHVMRERDEALRELHFLRQRLNEKKQNDPVIEDELNRSRQEVANAYREVGELRTRTHLVSTALQEARQKEEKFEKKISDLEEELSQSSKKTAGGPKRQEFNELQKRLVVLGCQLRKSEVSKRTYEVAVEKLTKFVERVYDTSLLEEDKASTPGSRRSTKGRRNSQAPTDIAQEARETVKSVKLLLEEEPLPFGWEEVYAPDGSRYYINHVTQTTSWLHPVSGIQHLASSQDDRRPPPLDQKL
eukprot:gene7408-8228_t